MTQIQSTRDGAETLFQLFNQLSENNDEHVEKLGEELRKHLHGQDPEFTTVSCCDSRVLQGDLWENHDLGTEFTHGVIGNHVNTISLGGEVVPAGSVDYIPEHSETHTGIVIIGHTGCGAVTATYQAMKKAVNEDNNVDKPTEIIDAQENSQEFALENYTGETSGISADIFLLMKTGLAQDYENLDSQHLEEKEVINRLVEYNVDNQVEFLKERAEYSDTEVFGAVYDMDGTYGEPGKLYLTNFNGLKNPEELRNRFDDYPSIEVDRQDFN